MKAIQSVFQTFSAKGRLKAKHAGVGGKLIAERYPLDFDSVPESVAKVIRRLCNEGHTAYLVGGCVRDQLLDIKPKDFDIATDARPEELKQLFGRRATIIGRRFRIVHIYSGQQMVEVTTFRGGNPGASDQHLVDKNNQVLVDNCYGSIEEDALRRDLTMNALYYDLHTSEILDFVCGYKDVQGKRIRIIGNPDKRICEDPVRMVRCLRFAAKLNFALPHDLGKAIRTHAGLLANVSPPRMLEEFIKLNFTGASATCLKLCRQYGVLEVLFPDSCATFARRDTLAEQSERLLELASHSTDQRVHSRGRVSPFYIIAVLLWPVVRTRLGDKRATGFLLHQLGSQAIERVSCLKIPKRFALRMMNVWTLQLRLQYPTPRIGLRILEHKDFRAAYDFLQLREQSGELPDQAASKWWQNLQQQDKNTQSATLQKLPKALRSKGQKGHLLQQSLFGHGG